MKRTVNQVTIIAALAVLWLVTIVAFALAEPQQTRIYDARGNSIGTATPTGQGSITYRDASGRTTGTSTTNSTGTTTFYGPGGNVTGRSSTPSRRN